jgi:hypothetical protein
MPHSIYGFYNFRGFNQALIQQKASQMDFRLLEKSENLLLYFYPRSKPWKNLVMSLIL